MKVITIIEQDDDDDFKITHIDPIKRRQIMDGYTCPICGKHVGSMEVHPCNQPWCAHPRDDGWYPGGAEWEG